MLLLRVSATLPSMSLSFLFARFQACVLSWLAQSRNAEPLLRNYREISKYARVVSRQRLGKNVPAVTDTHATIEVLLETLFSTSSEQRSCKGDNWSKNNCKRHLSSRQTGSYIRTITASVQLKKLLVVTLKGFVAKTNWLAVNSQSESNSGKNY
jgi:hypothetical protein